MKSGRLIVLLIFLSFIGLVVLYFNSIFYIGALELSIGEIDKSYIGKKVKVVGLVKNSWKNEFGMGAKIIDNLTYAEIIIFFENLKLELCPGMKIKLLGEVIEYKGDVEIYSKDIKIIEEAKVKVLLENEKIFNGSNVVVKGYVRNLENIWGGGKKKATTFFLDDGTAKIKCIIWDEIELREGIKVQFSGKFTYYKGWQISGNKNGLRYIVE